MSNEILFNVEQQAQEFRGEFTVLPPGWRKMRILKGSIQNTNSGGKMICLEINCDEGEFTNRLNIFNSSSDAQRIGRAALAKICECVGIAGDFKLTDMPKLFGRELDVKVSIEEFKSTTSGKTLKSNKATDYAPAGNKSGMAQKEQTETMPEPTPTESAPW